MRSQAKIPSSSGFPKYPMDTDGFAQGFDPMVNERDFRAAFDDYGIVVGKRVISPQLQQDAVLRLHEILSNASQQTCDFNKPESWANMPKDAHATPLPSRGFFEVYHDAIWAEIRQSLRLYIHHVVLWRQADLWTSFDSFGIKLPQHPDGAALDLHVDQNPRVHPNFKTIQGILALADNPENQGTFRGIANSRNAFSGYANFVAETYKGEYVPLKKHSPLAVQLAPHVQNFALRAGDIVSWDSRTTHANTSNLSETPRFVALVAAGPAPKHNLTELQNQRKKSFASGLGSNVRDALMHASMKPRFTDEAGIKQHRKPENLTLLGNYLYGFKPYPF